ncbi:MAG: hypothetical protein J6Z80_04835 [Clostridia bacterium]|nr:hypothetical protein [Clostridia bacterium]
MSGKAKTIGVIVASVVAVGGVMSVIDNVSEKKEMNAFIGSEYTTTQQIITETESETFVRFVPVVEITGRDQISDRAIEVATTLLETGEITEFVSDQIIEVVTTSLEIENRTKEVATTKKLEQPTETTTKTETTIKADTTTKTEITTAETPIKVTSGLVFGINEDATVSIKAKPNTDYSIKVYYNSGPSKAAGLITKKSDKNGNVSWTWRIGPNTASGTYSIVIRGGGQEIEKHFTVK